MLGKLFKYDIKASARVFLLLHGLYLLVCLLGRFLYTQKLNFTNPAPELVSSLPIFISLFILLFFVVSFGVFILILLRFYRNLFTDEGYLTWTLPATPTQQLWAKILSGTLWFFLDSLIIIAGLYILFSTQNILAAITPLGLEISVALGMPMSSYLMTLGAFTLLSIPCSAVMMYFCIAIGQLFPSHRVLCAIVSYFVFTFVIQILMLGAMAATRLFPALTLFSGPSATSPSDMLHYLCSSIMLSLGAMVILTVIEYLVTLHIMKKKINLI